MAEVTLTFDNGPDAEATPHVLEVLADRGLLATFFVVGERLRDPALRALAQRAHDEGHWIGNHTLHHAGPFGDQPDPATREREIGETQALLGDLVHPDRLFRPVGGGGALDERLLTPGMLRVLGDGGYTVVTWNAVPGDWKDPDGWVDVALGQCAAQERTLLVLHDLPTGAMAHLETFLDRLDAHVRQPFPEECVLLRRGEVVGNLDGLVGAD